MRRFLTIASACAAASVFQMLGQTARGQAPTAASAREVVGADNFIHVVSDVEKSIAFYTEVVGMDLQRGAGPQANAAPPPVLAPGAPRRYLETPEILRLYDGVGAQYRVAAAMIEESPMRAELIEFKDVERKPIHPRYQDPGAATLILTVRDIDLVMTRVKNSNTPIVTFGGEPLTISEDAGKMRAVIVKDPDGFFVELIQRSLAPPTAPVERNIIDVGFEFTVNNTETMMHVFKDALGFQPVTGPFMSDKAPLDLMGIPGGQYRRTTAVVPGSSTQLEFLEFRGIDRQPAPQSTTRDPGSPVLRLRVRDTDTMVKSLAAVGVKVTSTGGEPVAVTANNNTQRFAMTSAPDNLFIQIVQTVQRVP